MKQSDKDQGIIVALVERFEKERLPRALEIRERVGKGEKLSEPDLAFLEQVLADTQDIKPFIDRNPEYRSLSVKAIALYHEIIDLALSNEQSKSK